MSTIQILGSIAGTLVTIVVSFINSRATHATSTSFLIPAIINTAIFASVYAIFAKNKARHARQRGVAVAKLIVERERYVGKRRYDRKTVTI